jgi:hypothetical protein
MRQRLLSLALAAGLLFGVVPVAAAAVPATFGTPTAKSTFGTGVVFSQPVTADRPVGAEILLTIADAIGPNVVEVPVPVPAGGWSGTLTYTLDTSGNDHMIPNTPIVARWRRTAACSPPTTRRRSRSVRS